MDQLEEQFRAAAERWLEQWLRGPSRFRARGPDVGESAPDVALLDPDGNRVSLADRWRAQPLHLFFQRHYGCGCMKERWEQLNAQIPAIEAEGARTMAVGMGEPERTRVFMEHRAIKTPVLCDPEMEAFDAYGIVHGTIPAIIHDVPWTPSEEAGRALMASRPEDRRLVDDPWILPAEFVIDRNGVIRHVHRYQYCEDYPPLDVIVGAVRSAR